ncbi:Uncharacterised protein [Gordonia bronchialis]|nr:Uncharacterised protein [Gordonia bronchialis]
MTSMRRRPHVRVLLTGLCITVAATSATAKPIASVAACAVSVRRARLPVITDPTSWATTMIPVRANAIASRTRSDESLDAGSVGPWLCPAPIFRALRSIRIRTGYARPNVSIYAHVTICQAGLVCNCGIVWAVWWDGPAIAGGVGAVSVFGDRRSTAGNAGTANRRRHRRAQMGSWVSVMNASRTHTMNWSHSPVTKAMPTAIIMAPPTI